MTDTPKYETGIMAARMGVEMKMILDAVGVLGKTNVTMNISTNSAQRVLQASVSIFVWNKADWDKFEEWDSSLTLPSPHSASKLTPDPNLYPTIAEIKMFWMGR